MRSIEILIKPASSSCNMACDYCFYHDISNHRSRKIFGLMSIDTAKVIIDKVNEAAEFVTYAFQGGEPTLVGIEFFEAFTKYANHKNPNNNFVIQSNGLDLDREWAVFFRDNNYLVGLSLDGNKDLHNLSRKDQNGLETYNRVIKTIKVFQEVGVNFNILTVVDDILAKKVVKVYNNYKKFNLKFLQFIPLIKSIDSKDKRVLTPKLYGDFLIKLFDLWIKDLNTSDSISIRLFDNILSIYMGYEPESCVMKGHCSSQNVIEANGGVYPCDFYATDEHRVGNILLNDFKEIHNHSNTKKFLINDELAEECQKCQWHKFCRNNCKKYRVDNVFNYCDSYKKLFEHANDKFMDLANWLKNRGY